MAKVENMSAPVEIRTRRPLCVDLDGTLVKGDTFLDSLMVLARHRPFAFLRTPLWALKGKAYVKSKVAAKVMLDAAHLPYNQPLLAFLREEREAGRKLYLATGADRTLARKVADHLGIF